MNILPFEPAACNAAPNSVRTAPAREAISFPAILTEELFQRWLDLHPERRQSHERHTPAEQLQDRERVARMYALRGTPVTVAYARVLTAADALHDAIESLLSDFGPNEAERVLKAAGLRVPHPHDICQAYGAHTFQEQRKDCRRMKRELDEFISELHTLTYVLPGEAPDEPQQTSSAPAAPVAPAECSESPAVTPDACTKAAWELTANAESLLKQVNGFTDLFGVLADHEKLEQPIRDAVGVAWALDMFVSSQYGQLSHFDENGERLVRLGEGGECLALTPKAA